MRMKIQLQWKCICVFVFLICISISFLPSLLFLLLPAWEEELTQWIIGLNRVDDDNEDRSYKYKYNKYKYKYNKYNYK